MKIDESDKTLLLIILALTVIPLSLLLTVAAITGFEVTATYVLMIIGWFFGATMTWAWGKFKRS